MQHQDILLPASHRPPLRPRSPWWAWHLATLVIVTLLAPTTLLFGMHWKLSALALGNHAGSLWAFGLSATVPVANAVAMASIHYRHRRKPFTGRLLLMGWYLGASFAVGYGLFLLLMMGMFVPGLPPLLGPNPDLFTIGLAVMVVRNAATMALIAVFMSFLHAGPLYVWLAFRRDGEVQP